MSNECNHFTIRGYVAEVRKCASVECFNVFPPQPVVKFRRWCCPNCVHEIIATIEVKDGEEASKTVIHDEMKSKKVRSQDFSAGKTLNTERTQGISDGKREDVISHKHSIGNKWAHREQVRVYKAKNCSTKKKASMEVWEKVSKKPRSKRNTDQEALDDIPLSFPIFDNANRPSLNTRCAISTFLAGASKLFGSLDQSSKDALSAVGLLRLFTLPCITQNIPLLYTVIRLFDTTKRCFVVGGKDLFFTVNDVALILGLHNKGEEFQFMSRPLGSMNKHLLKAHLDDLANDASHPMSLRLDYLVRYILCCFFFPQKTYDLPKELLDFSGFADFHRYNWPQAVHQDLDDQLPRLAEKAKLGDGGIDLGYIGGCSIVLVIWILERTKYFDVPHPEARPRICRYSEKTNISYKACKTFSRRVKGKVLSVMVDITPSETELITDEDEV